jgi:hypothetical protein
VSNDAHVDNDQYVHDRDDVAISSVSSFVRPLFPFSHEDDENADADDACQDRDEVAVAFQRTMSARMPPRRPMHCSRHDDDDDEDD